MNATIGAGGMGEVYRATDTKLGRDVALKVLPADVAHDPERLSRFQREARAVAALNHPNIVTIFSVEEADGFHFLTMELVEGRSLDRCIPNGGMPVAEIVEIAGALAEALAAAHENGIVHRDLKPANVMVTKDGRVKVLDFGLAKDIRGNVSSAATMTSDGNTQAGMVMGTPAYMSPEQISGRPLDHRTDIFSLGVMLYEMATGQRPFQGGSSAELVSALLRDTPASVTEVRTDLPPDLARIIRRCLEKDPRHRLQTARDVSNEFRDLAHSTKRPTPVSASTARATVAADSDAVRVDEGFWVAVLPFKYSGTNADLMALAEGLSEEIITGLSRFSYLRVISRSSTARYAGQSVDVRAAGKELNARYVMEGTLRQAGSRLRLAVQLVDTASGAHLWAENYERAFSPESVFELQDDLVPRIVSTIADMNGVLPRSMSEALRSRSPEQLSAYEAVLRSFAYPSGGTPEELSAARACLEVAVRKTPGNADAWAMLSFLCGQDYVHGFELQANALEIAASAARRAVALGPSNHLAYFSLASVLWYQKDYDSFRDAAERAVTLNPMDGNSVAFMGELMTYTGDAERGMQWAERAKQLNPNHPGWYWYADFYQAFSQGEYRAALAFAQKVKMRGNPLAPMMIAAACGQLGDCDGGAKAVSDLLKFRPELPAIMRKQVAKVWNAEYGERFLEGLLKAGVEIPEPAATPSQKISTSSSVPVQAVSGGSRARSQEDEGFWVAVLPFKYAGNNDDLKALAEGLSEEVIAGLSRFSYLRVIARGSIAKYSSESGDVRVIGKELGARFVMEGSLRQAGNKLRLAVQLVEATTGSHLWGETFERALRADALFELQDELVPRIVSTVADMNGALPRSMSESVRTRDPLQLTPYEAVLRSFCYFRRVSREELAAALPALNAAVQKAPGYADAWAMLSLLCVHDYAEGFELQPDALEFGMAAAKHAVEADPLNHFAHVSLAQAYFFHRDFPRFRQAAERAVALNSMDGNTVAHLGEMFVLAGNEERGMELVGRAKQLNPHHPGWYWFADFYNAYRKGDDRVALDYALKINLPGHYQALAIVAAACGQLGEKDAAAKAVRELLKTRPAYAREVRKEFERWWTPEHVERLVDGLRKAGLEVPEEGAAVTPESPTPVTELTEKRASGATRTDEGFWIAVLPFKHKGSDPGLEALAEGITEEIITGMSRFSYLRVIAHGSTAKYSHESGDIRAIGKELGARYVMEGSIRQAGSRVRIAVQLVDAVSRASLWAETYERTFQTDAVFELQDELVPVIVSTVGDTHGVLPRTMSESLRGREPSQLSPYEAVVRCISYQYRVTAEDHAIVVEGLEHAVKEAPGYAPAWAMLAHMYKEEYAHRFNLRPGALERACAAARRAIEAAPSDHLAHYALAAACFFRKEWDAFRSATQRTIALNPMDGMTFGYLGMLTGFSGDWERGCAMSERARTLNPFHPSWYWFTPLFDAYNKGKLREALTIAQKVNMPALWRTHFALAAIYGQLGELESAREAVRALLTVRPRFPEEGRQECLKWWQPELAENLIDSLRKAGLVLVDTPDVASAKNDK